jgi:hypothetical protein
MRFINKAKEAMKNAAVRAAGVAAVSAAPMMAHAQASGVDFTTLTASINWGTVITAVMAVAASMVGVYVAIKGAKIVLRTVRGA